MAGHSSTMFQAMNERRKRRELCDFAIKADGEIYSVHRLVLDTCSEYFRLMFISNMKESNDGICEVKEIEAQVVEICIEFMYTGELNITADESVKVLKLAHMWRLCNAVKLCENILKDNLDLDRCFLYRRLASLYELEKLLSRCNEFIYSKIKVIKHSSEIRDISVTEIKEILQTWKEQQSHDIINEDSTEALISIDDLQWLLEKKSSKSREYWQLCIEWNKYNNFPVKFCQIVQQFPIEKLLVEDFTTIVLNDQHIKNCGRCKKMACKRFLNSNNALAGRSIKNCLLLKDLANRYNCEQVKQHLTKYILKNYNSVFLRHEFNELVPPDDLVAYMESLQHWKFSSEKFSVIASWIRFSPDRENIFPKLFQDRSLIDHSKCLFKLQDALFIKKLCDKYSCPRVQKLADAFITKNFTSIIKLPEAVQMTSVDLVSYLQKLNSYGDDPTEIWNFIGNWINHNYEQRDKFPAIFQALKLEEFSFTFIRQTIRTFSLAKESTECMSHLLDFVLLEIEEQSNDTKSIENKISELDKKLQNIEKIEKRLSRFERDLQNMKKINSETASFHESAYKVPHSKPIDDKTVKLTHYCRSEPSRYFESQIQTPKLQ